MRSGDHSLNIPLASSPIRHGLRLGADRAGASARRGGGAISHSKVPFHTLLLFAAPNLAVGVSTTAMSLVLPGFYAKNTLTTLAGISAGLLAARLLEVITDPLIGHLTDVTRSRWGPRKPWMLLGAILTPICMLFLFNPPASADATWFIVWSSLSFLAWTTINIPYRAWAVEVSRDYDERSKIFVTLGFAQGVGAIIFAAAPFLPIFKSTEMSPEAMRFVGISLAIAFPVLIGLTLAVVPQGEPVAAERPSILSLWSSIKGNRPLHWFLAAYMLCGTGQSVFLSCFLFFADSYLGLGQWLPLALVITYGSAFVGMPMWLQSMLRLGKPRTWFLGYGAMGLMGVVMAFIPPGEGALIPFLLACVVMGVVNSVDAFAPYALLGDVIDYDTWKTGQNRGGNYNALAAFLQKINFAVGGAAAFWLLGMFHYDVKGGTNGSTANLVFLLVFAGIPAVFYAASAFAILRFPLDRRRQTIVRRRLEQRAAREQRA
jgi:GPH family glycoside/pentoside/hexuronide:cation symporter